MFCILIDFFPTDVGVTSNAYNKRFHQDIFEVEMRYQGHFNPKIMADYSSIHKCKSKCLNISEHMK